MLAVPLLVGERVVGVLSLQSRRPRAYDEHQLSVLATIAQQAAVAVENAHHYTLATIDSLTGLHLRDYFFRRFEEEYTRVKRYAGAFSILMLDLDGFKEINDRHGHLAGRPLPPRSSAPPSGRACAAPDSGLPLRRRRVLHPASRDRSRRSAPDRGAPAGWRWRVWWSTSRVRSLRTTVSIGIASYPEHDTGEIKGLLLRADQALYQAKRADAIASSRSRA